LTTARSIAGLFAFLEVHVITTQPDLVTVTEAAKDLGTTRGMVHHHILTRRLPAVRVGRPFLIPRAAVEALRVEREAAAARTKATVGR